MSVGELIAVIVGVCFVLAAAVPLLVRYRRGRENREQLAAYAAERGLERIEGELPEVTPILWQGSGCVTRAAFRGELSEEREGTVGHYTYFEQIPVPDSGRYSASSFDLTVVLFELPETREAFPKLLCHGRRGAESTDRLDDALGRKGLRRLKLESAALNRRFEIFFAPEQDAVRLRRFFAPATIVWLAESMPTAFELVNGHLCCFAPGHLTSEVELDGLIWGAAELAWRLEVE